MKDQGFFSNWQAKLVSFLLAVATVYLVVFGFQQRREITLPLTVILPETEYEAISLIPQEAVLVVQGTEERIYMLNADRFSITADFSKVDHEGVSSVPVTIKYDAPSEAFDLSKISLFTEPASVRIYFEKK
ncbi:MAG: hypothetical protein ACSW73_00030 [Spirochaetales bacterium]